MNGKFWEIGRIVLNGTPEEVQKIHQEYPAFVQMWGSRCGTIYKNVPEKFKGQVPNTIAAARQISAFGDKLIECFEKGWITNRTTRKEIDVLYKSVCKKTLASRHP
jgi:hypothetical protein